MAEIVYQPFVIGGPNGTNDAFYRGDSFICEAAIHAGVISNERGGCGVVKVVGRRQDYVSSSHHGIKSVGFDSYFPLSFVFEQDIECKSRDMRWDLLAVSVVYTSVMSLFTASSALFFFANFHSWTRLEHSRKVPARHVLCLRHVRQDGRPPFAPRPHRAGRKDGALARRLLGGRLD
ncbi:hypothetical protein HYQ46_009026 [Verticillium longisporum]|nr:hypothetical protein HYQ46_009026 [Verticillium longisporum]